MKRLGPKPRRHSREARFAKSSLTRSPKWGFLWVSFFVFPVKMTAQQLDEPTTISGKPITLTVAFRLTSPHYQMLREQAEKEGKTVAALVQEWVLEKLSGEKAK
jgi:hypothetical protein